MKTCTKCSTIKEESKFRTIRGGKQDGKLRSHCIECEREQQRIYHWARKEDRNTKAKARVYDVSPGEIRQLLDSKVCGICGEEADPNGSKSTGTLNIDHDYKTGKIRGVLCWKCNTGLGRFKDGPINLLNAIEYLSSGEVLAA